MLLLGGWTSGSFESFLYTLLARVPEILEAEDDIAKRRAPRGLARPRNEESQQTFAGVLYTSLNQTSIHGEAKLVATCYSTFYLRFSERAIAYHRRCSTLMLSSLPDWLVVHYDPFRCRLWAIFHAHTHADRCCVL